MADQSRRHRRRLQNPQRLGRRDVLRAGSVGLLGLTLPELLRAQTLAADRRVSSPVRKAKACIMLFMWGGPAHQDTWDLKPDAPNEVRGEFRPIDTQVPGIQICEHFPLLAQRTQQLAIIRSMTHTNVDHTAATHYLLTGKPPLPSNDLRTDWPHFGAVPPNLELTDIEGRPFMICPGNPIRELMI